MKLYYKQYDSHPVEIPEDAILLNNDDIETLKIYDTYPEPYCWEVQIINKILNAPDIFDFSKSIIDIGACLGEYCWLLPFNHAYAFEPNRESLYRLHMNLYLHDKVHQCDTFQELCSDRVQTLAFDGWSTYLNPEYAESTTYIKTTTIDSHNFNDIGFIKIDVEGMEEEVLRGAIGTIIRNNYPPILFELFDVGQWGMTSEKHDSLQHFLEDLGYEIQWYWGDWETHLAIHKDSKKY